MNAPKKARGRSYGGRFGNACFVFLILRCSLGAAYALLFFVSAYFAVFRRGARAASLIYLNRFPRPKFLPDFFEVWRHNFTFGMCLVDRAAYFSGSDRIRAVSGCAAEIADALKKGRGLIVLSAHIGGRDIACAELQNYGAPVRIFGLASEGADVREVEKNNFLRSLPEQIDSSKPFGGMLEAYVHLKSGGILAAQFDRYSGGDFVRADFLGLPAKFPTGIFALAAKAQCPILYTACLRRGNGIYEAVKILRVDIPPLADKSTLADFADKSTRAAVKNVEEILRTNKYQWFNFYDYWNADE